MNIDNELHKILFKAITQAKCDPTKAINIDRIKEQIKALFKPKQTDKQEGE